MAISRTFRAALLHNEVGTEHFAFELRNFLRIMLRNPPKNFGFFIRPTTSRKIPARFPPCQKTFPGRVRVKFAQNEGHEKATEKPRKKPPAPGTYQILTRFHGIRLNIRLKSG